jgi:hypothetical protein
MERHQILNELSGFTTMGSGSSSMLTEAKPKTTTLISTWQARATALHELRIYALVAVTSATSSEDALMILYIERSERLWKLIPRVPQRVVGHYYLPPRSSTSIRYARIEFDRAS